MERALVLLLVTLVAVAYAAPGPRGLFLNLVRGLWGPSESCHEDFGSLAPDLRCHPAWVSLPESLAVL